MMTMLLLNNKSFKSTTAPPPPIATTQTTFYNCCENVKTFQQTTHQYNVLAIPKIHTIEDDEQQYFEATQLLKQLCSQQEQHLPECDFAIEQNLQYQEEEQYLQKCCSPKEQQHYMMLLQQQQQQQQQSCIFKEQQHLCEQKQQQQQGEKVEERHAPQQILDYKVFNTKNYNLVSNSENLSNNSSNNIIGNSNSSSNSSHSNNTFQRISISKNFGSTGAVKSTTSCIEGNIDVSISDKRSKTCNISVAKSNIDVCSSSSNISVTNCSAIVQFSSSSHTSHSKRYAREAVLTSQRLCRQTSASSSSRTAEACNSSTTSRTAAAITTKRSSATHSQLHQQHRKNCKSKLLHQFSLHFMAVQKLLKCLLFLCCLIMANGLAVVAAAASGGLGGITEVMGANLTDLNSPGLGN